MKKHITTIILLGTFVAGAVSAYSASYFVSNAKFDKKADKEVVNEQILNLETKVANNMTYTNNIASQMVESNNKIEKQLNILIEYLINNGKPRDN